MTYSIRFASLSCFAAVRGGTGGGAKTLLLLVAGSEDKDGSELLSPFNVNKSEI